MPAVARFLRRSVLFAAALTLASVAGAMSVIPPTFDELVAEADTAVRGVVTDIHAVTFESPEGQGIKTLVTLRVEKVLKGTPGETVTLELLGGKVGKRNLRVAGMPEFHVGDRQIVFFAGNGSTVCPLISAGHGRYHVKHDAATDRDYIARDNGAPLESTEEISLPLADASARLKSPARALAPADFESRVAASLARQNRPSAPR